MDEAQIRALIDDRVKAVRAKDIRGAMSNIAPDIVSFDVVNPLQHTGSVPFDVETGKASLNLRP